MHRNLIRATALLATLLAPMALHTPMAQRAPAADEPGAQARVIVKYRAGSHLMKTQALTASGQRLLQARALGQRLGIEMSPGIALGERSHVVTARGLSSGRLAARLAAQADVEYAVADEKKWAIAVPSDPFYATRPYNNLIAPTSGGPLVGQWYLKPPGLAGTPANTAPSAINVEKAWDVTTGSPGIVVAVLDTGVRFDHPDLVLVASGGNLLRGRDMISADDSVGGAGGSNFSTANDSDGRDDDPSDPGDWVTSAEATNNATFRNCTVENSSWHGTQTIGIVGARTDNGAGIAGIGRNVRVLPVRVLGKCGGYDSDIIAGMLWSAAIAVPGVPANADKARVVNLSLGGLGACSAAYQDAITQLTAAGVVVVASAGNSAGHAVGTPANCPGVISVAGLRHVGTKVGFSDIGTGITLAAPAGNCINTTAGSPCLYPIMTTSNAGTTTPVAGGIYTDSFNASLGTSFSAPLVAGTVALMLSRQPLLTPAEVRSNLQATARPFPTTGGSPAAPQCAAPTGADQLECYCTTSTCGAGMLDAHAAVLAVGLQARITVSPAVPVAGQSVVLSSDSLVLPGQTIATYAWVVSAGTAGAAISGAANGASVTVTTTTAGTFTAQLTVTDSNGVVSTVSQPVTVASTAPAPAASSDSGGGGAVDGRWLVLLLAAMLALAIVDRRRPATARLRGGDRG